MDTMGSEKEQLIADITNSYNIMQQIELCESTYEQIEEKHEKLASGKLILLVLFVAVFLAALLLDKHIFGGIIVAAATVAFFFLRSRKLKAYKRQMEAALSEAARLKADSSLSWLPLAYRDTTAFQYISSYIANMRANSLQEAINLYETEKHQARVELYTLMNNNTI